MRRNFREWSVAAALLAVLVLLRILAPSFYQPQPLLSLSTREGPVLLVACGAALVILARQIDISIGSQFGVVGVLVGSIALLADMFLRWSWWGGGRRRFEHIRDAATMAHRHRRDFLLHAVFVDFEVFLRQVGDELSALVLDDDVHRDGIDLNAEGGRLRLRRRCGS